MQAIGRRLLVTTTFLAAFAMPALDRTSGTPLSESTILITSSAVAGSHGRGKGPPDHAPAHGYRAKQGKGHAHQTAVPSFGILDGHCNRELLGQVLGGDAGAAAGSQIGGGSGQTIAIIGGTLLGVLIGGEIGRSMDAVDQHCVGQALEHAPQGQPVEWRNPDQDAAYTVVPRETYQRNDGRYCREYTTEARVGGRSQEAYGTACRQPDGSWEIVSG